MNDSVAYLDASAFVKLVLVEHESSALLEFLGGWPLRASCALLRTELLRAVRRQGPDKVELARRGLDWLSLIAVDDWLLDIAGGLDPDIVRSLDAIHLAAAMSLGDDLGVVVTYDARMKEGAEQLGLPVASPGIT